MEKTLFFHHYNDYSGSTKVLADYLSSNYDNLNDITVLTDATKEGFLSDIGVNLINIPIFRYKGRAIPIVSQIIWPIAGLIKTLRIGKKYDIFYINTIIPMYAAVAGSILNKKIIYHIHEKYVTKSVKSRIAEFIFNHVKAERKYVSKYVADKYLHHRDCIEYIAYNKLSKEFIAATKVVPLEEHKLNEVLMISSLQKGKGIDNFVKVAFKLPQLHFTLILSATEERIKDYFNYKLPPNLTLYPSQSNIHAFLQNADVILNLSIPFFLVETFGMTIIEGMAYGLPAIVPNAGGPMELIESGKNGYSIDVTDVSLVTSKIEEILNPTVYKKMYHNALKKVEQFKY